MASSQRRSLQLAPVYAALMFFGFLTLVPFAWMVCAAFKTNADVFDYNFLPLGDGFWS